MINTNSLRADFPIFKSHPSLVYLDNAATTHKPYNVIESIANYYEKTNSNVHRGVYKLATDSTEAYESARKSVGSFINSHSSNIIFTRGTTESVNLVASSFLLPILSAGDEVVVTQMEHHSNLLPWQWVCQSKGASLRVLPITEKGTLNLDELDSILKRKPKLMALVHVSNTLGTINPVKEIIKKAKSLNIPVFLDGAQAVAHQKTDVQSLGCDFYAFSGHKMYGPMGIGVLYATNDMMKKIRPFNYGGEMVKSVTFSKSVFKEGPAKFEAGTPNVAGAVGLQSAVEYLTKFSWKDILKLQEELLEYLISKLQIISNLKIIGSLNNNHGIVSISVDDIHPHDLGTLLDKSNVCVRAGHHCTQPIMDFFGIPGTVRISMGIYNTKDDIDKLIVALRTSMNVFK